MENFQQNTTIIVALTFFLLLITIGIIVLVTLYKKNQDNMTLQNEILSSKYQSELLKITVETQEQTFSNISRELHDNIGQLLNSTKLLIGITQRKMPDYPDTLTVADETLGTAINELRSLSKLLNKDYLQQFNLIENLQTQIDRLNASQALRINFSHLENVFINNDEQIILFRIIQEALQNAIKHSNASIIDITMKIINNALSISIKDNGRGFDTTNDSTSGVGLSNMKQRTQLLGGIIQWSSFPETGTTVNINVPLKIYSP